MELLPLSNHFLFVLGNAVDCPVQQHLNRDILRKQKIFLEEHIIALLCLNVLENRIKPLIDEIYQETRNRFSPNVTFQQVCGSPHYCRLDREWLIRKFSKWLDWTFLSRYM